MSKRTNPVLMSSARFVGILRGRKPGSSRAQAQPAPKRTARRKTRAKQAARAAAVKAARKPARKDRAQRRGR
ncbi:hypothetical protein [Mycolicibacterium iranicum]|uniref:hypothetical protein n=1 Tax=Mycolicibacterium iranicum TaxID=912594 RepID=UPI0039905C3C